MKALVLEIRDDKAAILTSEGQIIKVDNKQYRVGQEITFKGPKEKIVEMATYVKKWGTAIAAALFLLVSTGASYAYLKPYGVVSLDVNPSIEFTINRFDRVLNINGVNDDGRDILSCIDEKSILHRNIEDAIDLTLDTLRSEGYLKEEKDNYVVVAANTVEENHTDKLVGKIDESMAKQDNLEPITMKASDDELMEAREMGTTAGKMKIVEELDNSSKKSINKNEWISKSVAAIVKESDKNSSETLLASTEDVKTNEQAAPASSASAASTVKSSSGAGSNNSNNNGNNNNNSSFRANSTNSSANSGSKSGNKSKKSSTAKKSTETSDSKKAVPAAVAPSSGVDETSVGTVASASSTASQSQAASEATANTPAAATAPTAVPTDPATGTAAVPTAAPTPDPAATVIPVIPTVIPEIPVVDPVVTVPTDPTPSQPSEPAQPATPAQPSEPSTPSEPASQDSGSNQPAEQAQVMPQQAAAEQTE